MSFSENLYKLRKQQGLSQEDLAEKIDVSRQTISKWEMGQTTPEMDKLILLSNLFNVSIDELTNNIINNKQNDTSSPDSKKKHIVFKIIFLLLIIYFVISIYKFIALTIMNNIGYGFNENSYNIMMQSTSTDFGNGPHINILKIGNKLIEESYTNNSEQPYHIEYIDFEKRERCEVVLEDGKYVLVGDTKTIGNEEEINKYFNFYANSNYFRDITGTNKSSFTEKMKMALTPFSTINIFSKRITIVEPFKAKVIYEYNNDYLLNHTIIKNLQTGNVYETTISYDYVQDHFINREINNPITNNEYNVEFNF